MLNGVGAKYECEQEKVDAHIVVSKVMTNTKTEAEKAENNAVDIGETNKVPCCKIEAGGKKFVVIRHFVGEKDLGALLLELALKRANREMGL